MTVQPLSAQALAIQDRVFAVLREAGRDLSTVEVNAAVGFVVTSRPCAEWRHRAAGAGVWQLVECYALPDGSRRDVIAEQASNEARGIRALQRLEHLGLVRSIVREGLATRWVAVIRVPDRVVRALDELGAPWDVDV